MAVSFRRHGTTRRVIVTSQRCLLIHESSQLPQRIDGNPWPILKPHPLAASLIEHPAGHDDSEFLVKLDDNRRLFPRP